MFTPRSSHKQSFTLIELLVVITIIVILAAMLLPALSKARRMSKKTVCMNNERNLGLACVSYADDNSGFFYYDTYSGGTWPWDWAKNFLDDIAKVPRATAYCPLYTEQNKDYLWSFSTTIRTLSYMNAMGRGIGTMRCNGGVEQYGGWYKDINQSNPETKALIADGTVGTNGNFWLLQGSYSHRTSHIEDVYPEDSNHFFLDGHAEKLQWNQMHRAFWIGNPNKWFYWKLDASKTLGGNNPGVP